MDDIKIDISAYEGLDSTDIQDVETGDQAESTQGKTWWGKWRYFHIAVKGAAGSPGFPLPGVHLDRRNDDGSYSREPGPYMVKGFMPDPNSKQFVDLLICERMSQTGKAYHTVLKFTSFEKLRKEFQYPALKPHIEKLQATGKKAFAMIRAGKSFAEINAASDTWLYGKGEYLESSLMRKNQNGEDKPEKYVGNFEFYATDTARIEAEKAFWAERGGGSNGSTPHATEFEASRYPKMWGGASNMPGVLYDRIKSELQGGKNAKDVAVGCMLMKATGEPLPNADGAPVDVAWIFGQATGMPAEMFNFG